MKQLITSKIMGLVLALFFAMPLGADIITRTATIGDIRLTASYDNIACLNSTTTITYTLENTGDTPFADIIEVNDFVPDGTQPGAAGLTSPVVVPPQPSGVVTFDTTSGPNCGGASNGLGTWRASDAANPFPNNIPYSFTVTVTASQCGIWTFSPCLRAFGDFFGNCCIANESLGNITILVIPYAIFEGANAFFTCQDSTGIVGNLFPPSCFSPTSCTGASTGCDNNPFHYVITDSTGGTATLLDPTGGVFQFVPDSGFSGNGSISYNVISDTEPPAFCSPTGGNGVGITVVQKPFVSGITVSGCAGQGVTGDAVPSTTGGVPPYSFSIVGVPTCGDATITAGGIFTFTAPTGPGGFPCTFQIQASDSFLGCTGVGTVTVNVNPTPVPDNQTLQTCVNTALSGTLTATGGTEPYVFSITIPPTNGIISAFDPNTGDFIYTPNLNFTGTDSFTFDVTDAQGCISSFSGVITINVNPPPITSSTAINGCQNTSLTGSLLPLVTGGTGGAPVFQTTGPAPSCGGVLIFGNGDFTFSPNFGFTGCCDFQYAVAQGGCPGSGPSTVTVCISPAPVATGAHFDICQFSNLTGDLNDFLISSTGTTSFTAVGGPTNGTLFLNPSGPFSFTATIASGSAGFDYRAISDILPCPSDIEHIDITVHPNPTVATGMINACSGFTKTGNLNPLVSGGAPFTFTGPFSEVNGTATVNPNGTFTFTPSPGVTGGSFTFGVTNSFGCTGSGTEIIIVNDSPVVTGVTGSVCSNETLNGTLTGAVSGGTPGYIFTRVGLPSGGSAIVNTNGLFSFTPSPGATAGNFVFQATDQKGCFGTGPVDIFINLGPSASTGLFTGCEGGVNGDLATLVTGANPPFTFSGPIGPVFNGTVMVNPDGTFTFIPVGVPGQGSFNFIVTDSSVPPCTSNPTQVTINLEEGPQALPAFYDTCEDVPLVVSSASGLANFVTGGLPPYTFFQTGLAPVCGAVLINPDGSFTFTPTLGFTGDCDFNWQVTDSIPCTSNISTGTVTVHPTPLASNSGPFGACQLVPFLGDLNDFMSLGTPPYSFTGGNPVNGTINFLLATGPFSFTPIAIGLASFDYSAVDSFGCQSNTGTLLFSVAESPVVTSPSPLEVCQLSSVTSVAVAAGSPVILPVTFSITATVNGTAVINPITGVFTFTPNVVDFPTPTVLGSVTIRATAAPPSVCYGEVTVIINIHQNPIINITGLGSCTGTFTGNLAPFVTGGVPPYIFGPAGVVPTSPTGCGTVVLDLFGNFSFTANPPSAFPCPCSFTFTVTESSVSTCTSTGTVAVCVNQPPFANNAFFCACANTPVTGFLGAFVTGGRPPFTFAIIGVPVGGTVILNSRTGLFTFVPTPGFNGFASFQYQVTDSNNPPCISNIGTVTIQVPCCPVVGG